MIRYQIRRSKVSPCTSTTGVPLPRVWRRHVNATRTHIGKIASLDLAHRTGILAVLEPQLCPNPDGVAGVSHDAHAQSRPGAKVAEQPGPRTILADGEIQAPVAIIVGIRRAALLAVHDQTGTLTFAAGETVGTGCNLHDGGCRLQGAVGDRGERKEKAAAGWQPAAARNEPVAAHLSLARFSLT